MLETALLMLHYAPHARSPAASPSRSRLVYDFPTDTLVQYMYLRQEEAARALGVAPVTLKRICQRRKIRWPHRPYRTRTKAPAIDVDEDKPSPVTRLPSYCVYNRPPPELPEVMPKVMGAFSSVRPSLPSLHVSLGIPETSHQPARFFAAKRPHLQEIPGGARIMRRVPALPRVAGMNAPKTQLPPLSIVSHASEVVFRASPTTFYFALLPPALSRFA